MYKFFFVFLSLLTGTSFSQKEDSLIEIVKRTRIKSLKTEDKQTVFLESLYDLDQKVRETVTNAEQAFGYSSSEHNSAVENWVKVDRLLFERVVDYLELHSYPRKEMGGKACGAPIIIFHHVSGNQSDLILKRNYFSLFYQANSSGSIKQGFLWLYLFRFYQQVLGKEFLTKFYEKKTKLRK